MRGGAAHVKVVNRRAVVGPSRDRTEEKKLLEGELALENIALREAKLALEVERRENLTAGDNLFDVGGVLGDSVDDGVAESFALIVPGALGEFVGRILNETGHNVLARRSDTRIREAGDDDIDVRFARKAAILGVVIGTLHILDAGRNGNRAAQMSARAGQAFEIGKSVEREIYFAGRAAVFVATNTFQK